MAVEFGGGDSSARAMLLLSGYEDGFGWVVSTIWLPFYFKFFGFALFIHKSVNSILVLQALTSFFSIFVFYKVVIKIYDERTAIASLIFFSSMPILLQTTGTALSEILFCTLILVGIWCFLERKRSRFIEITGIIFMLAAVMTRYEGWILYVTLTGYDLIKTRSIKRLLVFVIPFCVIVGIHEYEQMKVGQPFLSGLLGNPAESSMANIRGGLDQAYERFITARYFWYRNIGIIWFGIPLVFYHFIRRRSCGIFELFFYAVTSMLLYSIWTNSIAIFERYFMFFMVLCIPVTMNSLFQLKSKSYAYLLSIISFYMILPNMAEFNYEYVNPGAKEILTHIDEETSASELYVDDAFTMYLFEAFKVYSLDRGDKVTISHIEYDIFHDKFKRDSEFTYTGFIKEVVKKKIEYFVLVEESNLSRVLLLEKTYAEKKPFELVKKFGRYQLYKFL
jgi:hypothetical protein